MEKVLQSLNQDLVDPKENTTLTENLRILNSSLHFVNNIKHLVRRASSVSTGKTLVRIFAVIQEVINTYVESILQNFEKVVS